MFYKSEEKENFIEKKNITNKNLLNSKKADKAATKYSAGYCKKRKCPQEVQQSSELFARYEEVTDAQVNTALCNASEKIFHPQSYNEKT